MSENKKQNVNGRPVYLRDTCWDIVHELAKKKQEENARKGVFEKISYVGIIEDALRYYEENNK